MKDEVDSLLPEKRQRLLRVDTIILGVCDQESPNYQNKNFGISLQYLKKEVSDKVNSLHVDKHENFVQIDTITFNGDGQAFPKFPK